MTTRFDLGFDPHNPLVEGDDRQIRVRVALDIGGTPQPIPATSTVSYSIFDDDPDVVPSTPERLLLTLGNGIALVSGDLGQLDIILPGASTLGLAGEDRWHRLRLTIENFTQQPFVGAIRFRERANVT